MKLRFKEKMVSIHGKMEVLDENDEAVYRVASKAITIHGETRIEDAAGNEVASMRKRCPSITSTTSRWPTARASP